MTKSVKKKTEIVEVAITKKFVARFRLRVSSGRQDFHLRDVEGAIEDEIEFGEVDVFGDYTPTKMLALPDKVIKIDAYGYEPVVKARRSKEKTANARLIFPDDANANPKFR